MKSFRLDYIICFAVAFLLFAASPLFAASASIGDAVANPDPWQMILGALVPIVMAWLAPKFPLLAKLLELIMPKPQPVNPTPAPDKPTDPTKPEKPLLDAIKLLLDGFFDRLLKRDMARAEDLPEPATYGATVWMSDEGDETFEKLVAAREANRKKADAEFDAKLTAAVAAKT